MNGIKLNDLNPSKLGLQGIQLVNQFNKEIQNEKKIEWEDFNYPPFLNLIHYNPQELEGDQKILSLRMNWNMKIIPIILTINLLSQIVQAAQAEPSIRIFYSFLNFLIFPPITFGIFYRGLLTLIIDQSYGMIYKLSQLIMIVLWFVFSIIADGSFDGFIRTKYLFDAGMIFTGILALIQSLMYLFNCFFSIYLLIRIHYMKK